MLCLRAKIHTTTLPGLQGGTREADEHRIRENLLHRVVPVQVSGLVGVVQIAVGSSQGVALKSDGTAWTWSQTWPGPSFATAQVNGLSGVTAIAAGGSQLLALKGDGTVWTWSSVSGTGTPVAQPIPVRVNGLSGVIAITAGDSYGRDSGLALRGDGTVWGWGDNSAGQLGEHDASQ